MPKADRKKHDVPDRLPILIADGNPQAPDDGRHAWNGDALTALRVRGNAMAAAVNGIVISDAALPNNPIVYANPAFLALSGYSEAEVVGRNCRFLQGPDTDPAAVREMRVRDAEGAVTHFIGIQTDVTARQRSDDARRAAEDALRQFQFLSEKANDAFYLLDAAGKFVYCIVCIFPLGRTLRPRNEQARR